MRNVLLIFVSFFAVLAISFFSCSSIGLFLEHGETNWTWIRSSSFALAMLLGIACGRIHKALNQVEMVGIKHIGKHLLNDRNLWKSLIVSPIVFGVIYSGLADTQDTILSLVFSFLNGFFWNVIMDRKTKSAVNTNVESTP